MPHTAETTASLHDVEELEPDPLGNPAAKALSDSVIDTPSGKPYDLIEGQLPAKKRPLDYENERILLARCSGRLALVLRLIAREGGEDDEADAELKIGDGLQHPGDVRAITESVMAEHTLDRIVMRSDAILVSPQTSLGTVDSFLSDGFHRPDDETLVLSRTA